MGFRTSRFWFPTIPLSCHPNYRALTFALAGLFPAEHTSLSWLQRLRKQLPEPVFGQIKQARGFRQFLLRGFKEVCAEWALICTAHNLLKLAKSRILSAALRLALPAG